MFSLFNIGSLISIDGVFKSSNNYTSSDLYHKKIVLNEKKRKPVLDLFYGTKIDTKDDLNKLYWMIVNARDNIFLLSDKFNYRSKSSQVLSREFSKAFYHGITTIKSEGRNMYGLQWIADLNYEAHLRDEENLNDIEKAMKIIHENIDKNNPSEFCRQSLKELNSIYELIARNYIKYNSFILELESSYDKYREYNDFYERSKFDDDLAKLIELLKTISYFNDIKEEDYSDELETVALKKVFEMVIFLGYIEQKINNVFEKKYY